MKLFVGFVTYRESTSAYLDDFLNSLFKSLVFLNENDYVVYALDNSGSDYTENHQIIENFNLGKSSSHQKPQKPVQYIAADCNYGFGRAYNILIKEAIKMEASYFLVVNPDIYFAPSSLQLLVAALDDHLQAAAAAPKILYWNFAKRQLTSTIDSLGIALCSGLRFIDACQGQHDKGQVCEIIGPSGAAGLFRLNSLRNLLVTEGSEDSQNYFDESFFMYKEDCDMAYRLYFSGHQTISVPESLIYHDRTARAAGSRFSFFRHRYQQSHQIRSWSFVNQHLIFIKHWKKQNFVNRFAISLYVFLYLIFALILEQFLLKQYAVIWRTYRSLTNIK